MPFRHVIVEIDRCAVDGLPHEILLDLDTVLVQGMLPNGPPIHVERDVVLTCPGTGRAFRATVSLPQQPDEMITSVNQATTPHS